MVENGTETVMSDVLFEHLMNQYGWRDIVICVQGAAFRCRAYHDGAWLEGYDTEPVIYWGA